MPIFEFLCQECGSPFEELVFSSDAVDEVICPSCGGSRVTKQISTFASKIAGSSGSYASAPAASCNTGSL